jgi:fumarylpyruvate hydrolase
VAGGKIVMTDFVFEPPQQASLAVAASKKRFAVRRVFCVGRNYGDHAREMGHDPDREPPFFFTKPADAAIDVPGHWPYPPQTENLHHEIELVVMIGAGGSDIAIEDANDHIFGYAVGLDMTRRDLQGAAKKLGRPWDWGKAFDLSAPCGPIHAKSDIGLVESGAIWLDVNGSQRQRGDISDLIWTLPEVISIVSHSMVLKAGDIIMTGTPAGVGAVERGDVITAGIAGLGEIKMKVV